MDFVVGLSVRDPQHTHNYRGPIASPTLQNLENPRIWPGSEIPSAKNDELKILEK